MSKRSGSEEPDETIVPYNGGSAGRFLRIEQKLDRLVESLEDFRVDTVTRLTRLETQASASEKFAASQQTTILSARSFRWVKVGIASSFIVGAAGLLLRIFGV